MVRHPGKAQHLFLYSTGTWLGHVIAQDYYGDEHYVWCTPYFDAKSIPQPCAGPPPSSCPKEIYLELAEAVERGDRHSAKVELIKRGILKGANIKRDAGIISDAQLKMISEIIDLAELREFKPLLYVMAFKQVKRILLNVDPKDKAHPLSPEYIIEHLPRSYFDIIDFSR